MLRLPPREPLVSPPRQLLRRLFRAGAHGGEPRGTLPPADVRKVCPLLDEACVERRQANPSRRLVRLRGVVAPEEEGEEEGEEEEEGEDGEDGEEGEEGGEGNLL